MIFNIIREIFQFVIQLLDMPISIDGISFSFLGILNGLFALFIAFFILGKFLGGGEE